MFIFELVYIYIYKVILYEFYFYFNDQRQLLILNYVLERETLR